MKKDHSKKISTVTKEITLRDYEQTMVCAQSLARHLWRERGERKIHFLLSGNLGAGKTHFIAIMIKNILADDNLNIPSPTFGIFHLYDNGKILHGDGYRIKNPDEVLEIGLLDYYQQCHCFLEWAEKFGDYLPKNYLAGELIITTGEERRLRLTAKDGDGTGHYQKILEEFHFCGQAGNKI